VHGLSGWIGEDLFPACSGTPSHFGRRCQSFDSTFPTEFRQLGIHFIGMSPIDRVRAILDGDKVGTFYQLGRPEPRGLNGHNPIGLVVNGKRGDVDSVQVRAEVSCYVGTQARLATAEAPSATFQLAWTAC